jgi:hypothetical protein
VTASAAYLTAHEALGRAATPAALTEGYTRAFAVGAGFLFAAALVALFMLKVGKEAVLEDDTAGQADAPVHAEGYDSVTIS